MEQNYLIANIDKKEYFESRYFLKLMEWSYNRNQTVLTLENLMAKDWKGNRVYVIGDYVKSEGGFCHPYLLHNLEAELQIGQDDKSLYSYISNHYQKIYRNDDRNHYRYIFNHVSKEYIDTEHCPLDSILGVGKSQGKWYHKTIAPLPLLLALGVELSGSDYRGNNNHLVGAWARDSAKLEICEEMEYLEYKEFRPDFYEGKFIPYTEKDKRIEIQKKHLKAERNMQSR